MCPGCERGFPVTRGSSARVRMAAAKKRTRTVERLEDVFWCIKGTHVTRLSSVLTYARNEARNPSRHCPVSRETSCQVSSSEPWDSRLAIPLDKIRINILSLSLSLSLTFCFFFFFFVFAFFLLRDSVAMRDNLP